MAGNQLGKTLAGGFEAAMHMTGRYPDWWQGKRFDRPVVGWVCGRSRAKTCATACSAFCSAAGPDRLRRDPEDEHRRSGRGARRRRTLRHHPWSSMSAAACRCATTKSYKAGREAFQGETLDFVSFDEEPPADIYTEGLTRTNIGGGPVWLTFTPLLGMSEVVRRFLLEPSQQGPQRHNR
jgi:phage terminase large subunit-like protein